MNAQYNRRSPNDRRLEQVFASVGELNKKELLEKFEQAFCEIVPPAQAAGANSRKDRDRAATAVRDEPAAPRRDRPYASRKSRPSGPPSSASKDKGPAS